MRLDGLWLLSLGSFALCLTQLLQPHDWRTLDAATELPARTHMEELHEVVVAQVEELVEINTAVGVLAECAFLFCSSASAIVTKVMQ